MHAKALLPIAKVSPLAYLCQLPDSNLRDGLPSFFSSNASVYRTRNNFCGLSMQRCSTLPSCPATFAFIRTHRRVMHCSCRVIWGKLAGVFSGVAAVVQFLCSFRYFACSQPKRATRVFRTACHAVFARGETVPASRFRCQWPHGFVCWNCSCYGSRPEATVYEY
jgi:hypothetical protein